MFWEHKTEYYSNATSTEIHYHRANYPQKRVVVAAFGYEHLKLDLKEILPLLNDKKFHIVFFCNKGEYDKNKVTSNANDRPRTIDINMFKHTVESWIRGLDFDVSFYFTTSTRAHKPAPDMWKLFNSLESPNMLNSYRFYYGDLRGRAGDLTDDDVKFAKFIDMPFKQVLIKRDIEKFTPECSTVVSEPAENLHVDAIMDKFVKNHEIISVNDKRELAKILSRYQREVPSFQTTHFNSSQLIENKKVQQMPAGMDQVKQIMPAAMHQITPNHPVQQMPAAMHQVTPKQQVAPVAVHQIVPNHPVQQAVHQIIPNQHEQIVPEQQVPIQHDQVVPVHQDEQIVVQSPIAQSLVQHEQVAIQDEQVAIQHEQIVPINNLPNFNMDDVDDPFDKFLPKTHEFDDPDEMPVIKEKMRHVVILPGKIEFDGFENEIAVVFVPPGTWREAINLGFMNNGYKYADDSNRSSEKLILTNIHPGVSHKKIRVIIINIDKSAALRGNEKLKQQIENYYRDFKKPKAEYIHTFDII